MTTVRLPTVETAAAKAEAGTIDLSNVEGWLINSAKPAFDFDGEGADAPAPAQAKPKSKPKPNKPKPKPARTPKGTPQKGKNKKN